MAKERSTSDDILRVARRLLESEGVEDVSMRRIAKEIGITPMAIYKHFPDRDALLGAIADAGFQELRARYLKAERVAPKRAYRMLSDEYLTFALKHPRLFDYMFSTRRAGARQFPQDFVAEKSPTASVAAQKVREGVASGFLRKGDVWEITMTVVALAHGMIVLYLGGRFAMSETSFRAYYRRSMKRLLDGIGK